MKTSPPNILQRKRTHGKQCMLILPFAHNHKWGTQNLGVNLAETWNGIFPLKSIDAYQDKSSVS